MLNSGGRRSLISEVPLYSLVPRMGEQGRVGAAAVFMDVYRGTSLIRNNLSVGPCSRPMPRAICWS